MGACETKGVPIANVNDMTAAAFSYDLDRKIHQIIAF